MSEIELDTLRSAARRREAECNVLVGALEISAEAGSDLEKRLAILSDAFAKVQQEGFKALTQKSYWENEYKVLLEHHEGAVKRERDGCAEIAEQYARNCERHGAEMKNRTITMTINHTYGIQQAAAEAIRDAIRERK